MLIEPDAGVANHQALYAGAHAENAGSVKCHMLGGQ